MKPAREQLTLFGLTVETPAPPRPDEAPPPTLEGQLDLLNARATRLVPVATLVAEGAFHEAAARCRSMRDEQPLALLLEAIAERVASTADGDALATMPLAHDAARLRSIAPALIANALSRGHSASIARKLAESGPAARALGRLAGDFWLDARLSSQASAAFEASAQAGVDVGSCLVALGNLRWQASDVDEARALWRRAFASDPTTAATRSIDDDATSALLDEAAELGPAPSARWVPVVGELAGLFAPAAPSELRDAEVRAFVETMRRSRAAARAGASAVELRRALKAAAPELFARVLAAGRC